MADTGSVFVNVTTTNYTPTINVASLFTGQGARVRFNLNITAPDGATADNIQIYINNLNPAAASVNQINPATGQIIQADITEFTLQQHLTGQIVQDQSGVNQDPNFKVAVSSYNGPQSAWFDVSTRFFPTPNMITRQITYDATSANDQTPLPLSNQNFDTLSNNVPQAVVYTLYYGNDPHAGIYRIGDFQNHITGFTQADADNATNPVLYFIPDGTGKKPDIWVSVSDGYNTLPKVPIDMVLNIAPDVKIKSSLPAWAGYVPGGTIGFATLTYFGLDYRRHYLNSFANMIRHATSMGHSKLGYRLFDSTEGDKFCELIDALMTASGMKGDIDFQMKQYNYFSYRAWVPYVEYPPEKKLKRMAKAFANILERHMVKGEICGLELYYSVKGHPINKALIKRDREEKAKENQSNQIKLIGTAIANEYARIKDLPDEACCASIANCFSWKNNKDDNGIVFTSNNRPQSEKELERMQSFSGSGSGSAVSTVKL